MKKSAHFGIISAVSALSGFCNALLGAGGGILLSLAMSGMLPEAALDRKGILATAQAAMIPGCIVSCVIYGLEGRLDLENFAVFAIPAMLGGALGSLLLNKVKTRWLIRLFSLFVIWSGARMLLR